MSKQIAYTLTLLFLVFVLGGVLLPATGFVLFNLSPSGMVDNILSVIEGKVRIL